MTPPGQRARSGEITAGEASRIDMQAFDGLPESYRDLIRYAQIEIPATVACAYLAAFGQRLGLLFLRWAVGVRCRKIAERHGAARRATVAPRVRRRCRFPAPQARSRSR